jgi:hypothetical protein
MSSSVISLVSISISCTSSFTSLSVECDRNPLSFTPSSEEPGYNCKLHLTMHELVGVNIAEKYAVTVHFDTNVAGKYAITGRFGTDMEEKYAIKGRRSITAEERSSITDHPGITSEEKSSVSGIRPDVRGVKPMTHALCSSSRRVIYGGGSPHAGKAGSRSSSRTRVGSTAGELCQGGETSYGNEGAGFTDEAYRD